MSYWLFLFGGIIVFATYGGIYFWFPKITGRMMDERLGNEGMPRRYADYLPTDGFTVGFGRSLEWATSCPPPRHNFTELPRIRSEAG